MWPAEAVRLRWLSGTSLGREVVPDVWSMRATSSGEAKPARAGAPESNRSGRRVKPPAGPWVSGTSSTIGMPRATATARAGLSMPSWMTSTRAFRSER